MTIKHIILAGGGPCGIIQFGIIKQLLYLSYIKYEDIKSIYATSIGTIIGLIFILNCDYNNIENYIINRPLEDLIDVNINNLFNIFYTKGIIKTEFFKEIIRPIILASKFNLNDNSTLLELYNETKIKFNLISVELNNLDKIIINYETFPDLKIYEAINMSCGIFGFVEPYFYNNKFYIDGGLISNCPVNECLIGEKCKIEDLFIIANNSKFNYIDIVKYTKFKSLLDFNNNNNNITKESDFIDFLLFFITKLIQNFILFNTSYHENTDNNLVNSCISKNMFNLNYWLKSFLDKDEKNILINIGKHLGNNYYKNKHSNNNNNIYDLSNIDLSNIDLSNIDLSNIDLSNIDLSNIDLSDIDLSDIDLSNIDLSDIDLYNIRY